MGNSSWLLRRSAAGKATGRSGSARHQPALAGRV